MKRCPRCGYREPKPMSHVRRSMGLTGPKKRGQGVRIGDRWPEEKGRRGYVEPGSFVRRDGSEKLVGRDWKQRVYELALRAGTQCEMWTVLAKHHVLGCNSIAAEPHHIVKRSIRRDDRISNLALLSHACHESLDNRVVKSGKVDA